MKRKICVASANMCGFRIAKLHLMCGTALAGLIASGSFAMAQDNNAGVAPETVVVTGSLIRGVSHTGSDLISLDQDAIKQVGATSTQQLLNSLPALSTFGSDGAFYAGGSQDASGSSSPVIHGIGAVVSDGTLVLIDGHRISDTGVNQVVVDPGVVPDIAIQRVEVLPDGASSLYGADAVAGVVNFITRKDFEGLQTQATVGTANHFQNFDFGQLAGFNWGKGGMVLAYQYSSKSNLLASDRSQFTAANQTAIGGTDGNSFNCGTATISQTNAASGAASNIFVYPYTGATIGSAGNSFVAPCDYSGQNSLGPSEAHNAVMISAHHQLTDNIVVNFDINLSSRIDNTRASRGTVSATAFGSTGTGPALGTSQRNPFYVGNSTTGTASEFIRYDFNDLLGPGAHTKSGARDIFADLGVDVDLGGGWAATAAATSGYDIAFSRASGVVSAAEALLALNGTTNTSGTAVTSPTNSALSDFFGLTTVTSVTRALTTADALDVWDPPSSNKTPAQVIKSLSASQTNSGAEQSINDVRLKFDGPLFDLPAGTVRAAVGGQYDAQVDNQISTTNNATGPSNNSSRLFDIFLKRNVYSAYAEFFVPLISPEMNVPLVQKLDLDISGRYDHYSDFGDTENPKVGLSWIVTNGLTARASYGTSFAAPKFNSEGQPGTGITNATSVQTNSAAFVIPATHPNYPGSFCTVIVGPCNVTTAMQGIAINSGNPNIKPQTGLTYSVGLDIDAGGLVSALKGLHASVTYWQVKYQNVVDRPLLADVTNTPGLQGQLLLAPPGGWSINDPAVQKVISVLPITGNLPATVFYIYDGFQTNAFNDQINGIDFDVSYGFDTGSYGAWLARINGSDKLRFDSQGGGVGSTAPYVSYLQGIHNSSSEHVIALAFRTSLQWTLDPVSVSFFWNFTNPYWNPITTPPFNTATLLPTGVTGGGYQKVTANNTFDLDVNYTVPQNLTGEAWMNNVTNGTTVSLHMNNILNSRPPYYAGGAGGFGGATPGGYDAYNASPLGRLVTLSLKKNW